MSQIVGLVLAAGRSRRFGDRAKLLCELEGRPLIEHVLPTCVASELDAIRVVTRRHSPVRALVRRRFVDGDRLETVDTSPKGRPFVESLQVGLEAVPEGTTAALIVLGDMPRVTSDLIDEVIAIHRTVTRRDAIILPTLDGRPTHPRLFPRPYFSDFAELEDRESAKRVLERRAGNITPVAVDDPQVAVDVDTPEDLERLRDGRGGE